MGKKQGRTPFTTATKSKVTKCLRIIIINAEHMCRKPSTLLNYVSYE